MIIPGSQSCSDWPGHSQYDLCSGFPPPGNFEHSKREHGSILNYDSNLQHHYYYHHHPCGYAGDWTNTSFAFSPMMTSLAALVSHRTYTHDCGSSSSCSCSCYLPFFSLCVLSSYHSFSNLLRNYKSQIHIIPPGHSSIRLRASASNGSQNNISRPVSLHELGQTNHEQVIMLPRGGTVLLNSLFRK